jgi:PASTA domain
LDDGSSSPSADTSPAHDMETAAGSAPDFRGESLRGAFAIARARRIGIETSGDGYVVAQKPPPGVPVRDAPVQLTLSDNAAVMPAPSHDRNRHSHPARSQRARRANVRPRNGR